MSDDLVPLAEAARRMGRSVATIRRWVRDGHVTRHEGPPAPGGGSPLALVAMHEVLTYAAAAGLLADPGGGRPAAELEDVAPDEAPPLVWDGAAAEAARLRVELAEARAAVAVAELRGEVARLTAERDALSAALTRAEAAAEDARREREHWRELAGARAAELDALRALSGRPWWRALLGG